MRAETVEKKQPPHSQWDAESSVAVALERAKEELELVSYVTSHDLKTPLRTILATCDELKRCTDMQAAQQGVQKIAREGERMKTLMQGILDYLHLETFGPSHLTLDANEIFDVALTILEEKIRATSAKVTHDPLPHVYGHRGRLSRLFVNLLDNALKFHSTGIPIVHVSAHTTGDYVTFCVTDNGIGIDEEYHQIIFSLFQRLHGSEAYPGNGIGLALSRKIVESHGGKLWVESASGEGSRFHFTLPVVKTTL